MGGWFIVALLALSLGATSYQNQPDSQQHEHYVHKPPAPAPAPGGNPAASPTQQAANNKLCKRLVDALVVNWPLIAVGIGGIWVALRALKPSENAADAAKLNAQAVIDSERPWIVVKVWPSEKQGQFFFEATNTGRTVAIIISNWTDEIWVKAPDNEFPDPPKWKNPATFPMLLAPNDSFVINALGSFPDEVIKSRGNPAHVIEFLIFCGRIEYRDVMHKESDGKGLHESRWCFSYAKNPVLGQKFLAAGPKQYNDCT
jgi:hypothetical protein